MKKTIFNWKQLSEIMRDNKMSKEIVGITMRDDKLESLTFATFGDASLGDSEWIAKTVNIKL